MKIKTATSNWSPVEL